MATERYSIGVDSLEDSTTAVFARIEPDDDLHILNKWTSAEPGQRWFIRAPYDGYYSINGGASFFARVGDDLLADSIPLPVEKPWWRKVIWRSVFIYTLSLLTATTLALGFHEPWYVMPLWYALYLPLACAVSRSYL